MRRPARERDAAQPHCPRHSLPMSQQHRFRAEVAAEAVDRHVDASWASVGREIGSAATV
jgi:hypothetical protein